LPGSIEVRRQLIEPGHACLSVRQQCELVGLSRASYYYEPAAETAENLALMRQIDEVYTKWPFFGSRRMALWLGQQGGEAVNRKRVQRLMRRMGLEAVYCKPRTSQRHPDHRVWPYLLRSLAIDHIDHVWGSDITYVPMAKGYLYLVAVMDWYSRRVLAWRLSNTLDGQFCEEALAEALSLGRRPEIFNTDQGAQFTARSFTDRLQETGIAISMDGRGRALDNVFVERLWRTVKYEHLYLHAFESVAELEASLAEYLQFYNELRPHQSLHNQTPAAVYAGRQARAVAPICLSGRRAG
jgi:putative transposase